MKIVVTVKPVPDTTAPKLIDPQTLRLQRTAATVLNPFDEFALEAALRLRESIPGATVTALALAPGSAREALRKALGMGADVAVLASDAAFAGADARLTALVLAKAAAHLDAELVMCGTVASDAAGGVVPRMIAERLGWTAILGARTVAAADGRVRIERCFEGAAETLAARLPAVLTVTREIGAVRYPSLKGIMASKNKPIVELDAASLGIDPAKVAPPWQLTAVTPRPARAAAQVVTPGSAIDAAQTILAFLHERKALEVR